MLSVASLEGHLLSEVGLIVCIVVPLLRMLTRMFVECVYGYVGGGILSYSHEAIRSECPVLKFLATERFINEVTRFLMFDSIHPSSSV